MTEKTITDFEPVKDALLKTKDAYKRIQVCEKCDKYIKLAKICGVCKCFMPAKTRLRYANCPLDKWEIVDGDTST